ncbi:hypothetical protein J6590_032311 [Homalodisca vitripennis]|nr:hypothetical protein J6590_032311 [Homalodisca vitripennis]
MSTNKRGRHHLGWTLQITILKAFEVVIRDSNLKPETRLNSWTWRARCHSAAGTLLPQAPLTWKQRFPPPVNGSPPASIYSNLLPIVFPPLLSFFLFFIFRFSTLDFLAVKPMVWHIPTLRILNEYLISYIVLKDVHEFQKNTLFFKRNATRGSHADMKNWYSPIMMERFGRGVVMSWWENNVKTEEQGGEEEVEDGNSKSDAQEC